MVGTGKGTGVFAHTFAWPFFLETSAIVGEKRENKPQKMCYIYSSVLAVVSARGKKTLQRGTTFSADGFFSPALFLYHRSASLQPTR